MTDDTGLRECRSCHEVKPFTEFGIRTRTVRRAQCKVCLAQRKKTYLDRHPEHRQRHNEISSNSRRKRIFGLTTEEYHAVMKSQDYVCAICKAEAQDGTKLGIDHNHKTGQVRGALCITCNAGLGMFHDDPDLLHRAVFYLTERLGQSSLITFSRPGVHIGTGPRTRECYQR